VELVPENGVTNNIRTPQVRAITRGLVAQGVVPRPARRPQATA
jgi:hypothetical protein